LCDFTTIIFLYETRNHNNNDIFYNFCVNVQIFVILYNIIVTLFIFVFFYVLITQFEKNLLRNSLANCYICKYFYKLTILIVNLLLQIDHYKKE